MKTTMEESGMDVVSHSSGNGVLTALGVLQSSNASHSSSSTT